MESIPLDLIRDKLLFDKYITLRIEVVATIPAANLRAISSEKGLLIHIANCTHYVNTHSEINIRDYQIINGPYKED